MKKPLIMKIFYSIGLIILALIISQPAFPQKENLKNPTDNEQQIELSEGYSFISSHIIAENPDMLDVLQNNLANLEFVRNTQGLMLQKIGPVWVNNIGDWVNTEGYLFKMSSGDNLIITGDIIDPQTPVELSTGYQLIGYLPDQALNTEEIFQEILDNLEFVRNTAGLMFRKIGPVWVNSIGDMQPGEGYLVKMNSADVLIYPGSSSFTCGDPLTDPRDEQVYTTVQIGDQCWMAENLNIGTMINGSNNMSNNGIIEKYCQDNNTAHCNDYGGLYMWDEMMQYTTTPGIQGICPDNWHVPTDEEWKQLEGEVDSQYGYPDPVWDVQGYRGYDAGLNLKTSNGWNGADLYGFTALPIEARYPEGWFGTIGDQANFWTSNENDTYAYRRMLSTWGSWVNRQPLSKSHGFSVRCLKGVYVPINLPPEPPSDPNPEDGAVNQSLEIDLSWTCTDPEGDPLTYDIYFGTEATPPQVATGQTETTYDPGTLDINTDYFWKIVAHDDHSNTTEGLVWNFSTSTNQPPNPPYNPSPANGTTNQPLGEYLSWSCTDPEGDPLTYDIYFGTEAIPPIVSTGQTNTNYFPGTLLYGTTYFWNIVAHDNHGNTTIGPVWSFTTIENQPPIQPYSPYPEDGSENQPIEMEFTWSCGDPNGDPLTFDVYFGTEATPPLVSTGQVSEIYNPGTMENFTQYFWKIVAHDYYENTTEGPVWSFTTRVFQCGYLLLDNRDGQTYPTVQIGDQCWMKENMNIGTMIGVNADMSNNGIIEKYCYDGNIEHCESYGGLYQGNEAMEYTSTPGGQGICPAGWHIPTDNEWKILEGTVDSQYPVGDPIWNNTGWRGYDAGYNLKSIHNWTGAGGSDLYGFCALPAGWRHIGEYFFGKNVQANFWSSSIYDTDSLWHRVLNSGGYEIGRSHLVQDYGISVRCLQGVTPVNNPPEPPSNPNPESGAENQSIEMYLSWYCNDPDGDPLTFDVYFGMDTPLPLVSSGQTGSDYEPETLQINTTYYWKIIAHDDHENTTEGPIWYFVTGDCVDTIIDQRDGKVYNIVQIFDQCWMAENLNIGIMINGDQYPSNNGSIEKYCYDNNSGYCEMYGGLYQWDEMMQYTTVQGTQGICPSGWHIPTDDEWKILEGKVDSQYPVGDPIWDEFGLRGYDAGKNLKSTSGWIQNSGENAFGFNALPGGYHDPDENFYSLGSDACFWSSTWFTDYDALFRNLWYISDGVSRFDHSMSYGKSVRCLRD